jgi:phosphotransferase system enzyme I (PtsI)
VLRDVLEQCCAANTPVAVCGEVAGDPRYTAYLLRLGLTDFSMHPGSMLAVRKAVRDSRIQS